MTQTMPTSTASDRDLHLSAQIIRDASLPYRLMFTILRETGTQTSAACQPPVPDSTPASMPDSMPEPDRELLCWQAGNVAVYHRDTGRLPLVAQVQADEQLTARRLPGFACPDTMLFAA